MSSFSKVIFASNTKSYTGGTYPQFAQLDLHMFQRHCSSSSWFWLNGQKAFLGFVHPSLQLLTGLRKLAHVEEGTLQPVLAIAQLAIQPIPALVQVGKRLPDCGDCSAEGIRLGAQFGSHLE
jgi:hypothetical protein